MKLKLFQVFFFVFFTCIAVTTTPLRADGIEKISDSELIAIFDEIDLVILDIRRPAHWKQSEKKIAEALREDPYEVSSWGQKYDTEKKYVLYCACPLEFTSNKVARKMQEMGFQQIYILKGGWKKWEKNGFPTEPQ